MNDFWENLKVWLYLLLMASPVIIVVLLIILNIYAVIAYAGVPASEVPYWVIWLTMSGGSR